MPGRWKMQPKKRNEQDTVYRKTETMQDKQGVSNGGGNKYANVFWVEVGISASSVRRDVKIVSKLSTGTLKQSVEKKISPRKDIFFGSAQSAATTGLCVRSDRKENRIFNRARGGKYEDRKG